MPTYEEGIRQGLTAALGRARRVTLDLAHTRLVILSDMHRGQGDGADDFRHAQKAYSQALRHYHRAGFSIDLLGDVEELWEARAERIVAEYKDVLELEQSFIASERLRRFFGNHDIDWSDPKHRSFVHLAPYLEDGGKRASVEEAIIADVTRNGEKLGDLFIVHGHQGTLDSDKYSGISRLFVRYIWRNIQRLLGLSITTPSSDFSLRLKHETAMYEWAIDQPGLVIVTGHTHHPVFMSVSEECFVKQKADDLENTDPTAFDTLEARDKEVAELRTRRRELVAQADGHAFDVEPDARPAYFNSGCCSFNDGTITGLEIEDGSITLVEWHPDGRRVAQRPPADLAEVFASCQHC